MGSHCHCGNPSCGQRDRHILRVRQTKRETQQVTPMALQTPTLLATEAAPLISATQARTPALKAQDLWGCSILSSGIPNPRKKSMKLN